MMSASDNETRLRSCLKGLISLGTWGTSHPLNYEVILFLFFLFWDKKQNFLEKEKL